MKNQFAVLVRANSAAIEIVMNRLKPLGYEGPSDIRTKFLLVDRDKRVVRCMTENILSDPAYDLAEFLSITDENLKPVERPQIAIAIAIADGSDEVRQATPEDLRRYGITQDMLQQAVGDFTKRLPQLLSAA